nr:hypothetical protein [Tanacetum cinerariifolium]
MVLYVNVLRSGVLDTIAAESNGTTVITIQGYLVEDKTVVGDISDEDSYSLDACNWCKGFLEINSLLLSISLGHQPCLVF